MNFLRLRIDFQEFHFKIQGGMGRNISRNTGRTIAIICRNMQDSLFSNAHGKDTFIPTANDFSHTNLESKGTSLVNAGIELFTVGSKGSTVPNKVQYSIYVRMFVYCEIYKKKAYERNPLRQPNNTCRLFFNFRNVHIMHDKIIPLFWKIGSIAGFDCVL